MPKNSVSSLFQHFSARFGSSSGPLPQSIARVSEYGLYALLAGCVLMGIAFLTNPIPDPSFPWATLPASFRVSYTQPRIEHWPVTYSVGLWMIVFTLPLVLLHAYQRYGPTSRCAASWWLTEVPVVTMLVFTTYCRFFWPKLDPATWNAPSYTLVCWAYCSSYIPFWSDLAYVVALVGIGVVSLAYRDSPWTTYGLAAWGILAFPLGIPALCDAYRDIQQ